MAVRGQIEHDLVAEGHKVLGVDEVGRGCLAGPVFAGCTSLDYNALADLPPKVVSLIRDSKKLSASQRQSIIPVIEKIAVEAHVAMASVAEIEQFGIVPATFLAMRRAIERGAGDHSMLLIDGNQKLAGYAGDQRQVIGGDNLCYAIAAASILAKEARDMYMREQAEHYPTYGFEQHVGYGTKAHLEHLATHGACPLHRRNFAPIRQMIASSQPR